MGERAFGIISLIIACGYVYVASLTKLSFISDPVGPKQFPYILGFFWGLSSLLIIFQPEFKPKWPSFYKFLEIIFITIVLIAYAYALPVVGFVISTLITTFILAWRLGVEMFKALMFGLAVSFTIYFLFHGILGLSLAKGMFGF